MLLAGVGVPAAVLGMLAGMMDEQPGLSILLAYRPVNREVEVGIEPQRPLSSARGDGGG